MKGNRAYTFTAAVLIASSCLGYQTARCTTLSNEARETKCANTPRPLIELAPHQQKTVQYVLLFAGRTAAKEFHPIPAPSEKINGENSE
jgi:hypothetical protein